MLSVATAGMLDAVRFRRGREYASTGAVRSLDVDPGVLRGEVQGSRRTPYDVTVRTAMVPPPPPNRAPTSMPTLAPSTSDLRASCTCPDADEGACKHIVAVLLSFADEVSLRPELLVTWRCAEGAAPPRARDRIAARCPDVRRRQRWFGGAHERPAVAVRDRRVGGLHQRAGRGARRAGGGRRGGGGPEPAVVGQRAGRHRRRLGDAPLARSKPCAPPATSSDHRSDLVRCRAA